MIDMKSFLPLLSSLLLTCFIHAQDSTRVANWSFGATKGYALIDGEVDPGSGFAFGFHATKHFSQLLSARLYIGMGDMQGQDDNSSQNWLNHPGWNGQRDPNINYNMANSSSIYANYKTSYQEVSLQGQFRFSQLPFFNNKSAFDGFLLVGIGAMRFQTKIDAADANQQIYDFSLVDELEAQTEGRTQANLRSVLDGEFETTIKEETITPLYQFGAGISWQFRPNINLSLSHRIALTGTDELDTYQWDTNNQIEGNNDIQHFTSVSLSYTLRYPERPERPIIQLIPPVSNRPLIVLEERPFDPSRLLANIQIPPELEKSPVEEEVENVILTKEEAEVVRKAFDNLEFETGKEVIRLRSYIALNELAGLLINNPDWKLRITGHTDNIGDRESNKQLSQRRAEAVRDYIIEQGVAANRFLVDWYGEERPIADNSTEEGRQKNRRVEMEIVE